MNRFSLAVLLLGVSIGSDASGQSSSLLRATSPNQTVQRSGFERSAIERSAIQRSAIQRSAIQRSVYESSGPATFPNPQAGSRAMTLDAPGNAFNSSGDAAGRVAQVPSGYPGGVQSSGPRTLPNGQPMPGQPMPAGPIAPYGQAGRRVPGDAAVPGMAAPGAAGSAVAGPLTIDQASWTYRPPPPLRVFNKNDVVTIRVDEITRVTAEGASESRKRTLYEAILTDWIRLDKFRLRPDPQVEGDPTVGSESNANYRAEATVESRESLTFNIAATIVDIRPNGILVLEGTKTIRVNDNLWETSLIGMCRAQDIAADNVVLSKDLIDLQIQKQDRGHLRDSYRRGWFQRWFDRVQPF